MANSITRPIYAVRAGRLRSRIRLERPIQTQSASGGVVKTWEPVQTVRADVTGIKGYEQAIYASAKASLDSRIEIRWSPKLRDLNATWRAVLISSTDGSDSTIYDIASVVNVDGRNTKFEILCGSGLTNG